MEEFSYFDYSIIVGYLTLVLVLGLAFSKRQKSLGEYFHAGRGMPWWAVGISLLATGLSPITYLSSPGWIFAKDSRMGPVGVVLAVALVPLAAAIWLPLWGRLRVMTIYEYLELRYHVAIRLATAVLFFVITIFWLGTALITAAMGFESATGFDARWCLVIMVVLGTAYTVLGGMRAVIWTDVAQFIIFMLGYGAIFVVLLAQFDWNPMEIYRIASSKISEATGHPHTKLISFELDLSIEATIWVIIFLRVLDAISFGSNQMTVQRLHSTGSRREMYKSMLGSYIFLFAFIILCTFASWGFVAFYHQNPQLAEGIVHTDQVLPYFVVNQLPTLIRSLIMAGVLAALMSSFDSAINSMSNVAVNDFYRRFARSVPNERRLVWMAKILTLLFGLFLLGFGLWQMDHQGPTAMEKLGKLTNVIASPTLSFFLLGILFKRTNTWGAVCGAVAGISFSLVFNGIPDVLPKALDWLNWMWIGGLATVVNVAVGYAASFIFAPPHPDAVTRLSGHDNKDGGQ